MSRNRRSSRAIDVVYRFEPTHRGRRRQPRTPTEALRRLLGGNRRFAGLLDSPGRRQVIPLDPSAAGYGTVRGVAPPQEPFAAVLGCSDARAPVEMIFEQRSGLADLALRVAGSESVASQLHAAGEAPRH